MYVKIQRVEIGGNRVSDAQGSRRQTVVPNFTDIFEVDTVSYRKVVVQSIEDWPKKVPKIYRRLGKDPDDDPTKEKPFEVVILKFSYSNKGREYVVVNDCSIFIMNNNGDTISKIVSDN